MAERVRQYIDREAQLVSNMNKLYGIIWGQCTPGLKSVLKGNEDFFYKSKKFDLLWIMQEKKNITTGMYVKLNKLASLYHCIRSFINLRQGENERNDTFKLRWDNVYETMELEGG